MLIDDYKLRRQLQGIESVTSTKLNKVGDNWITSLLEIPPNLSTEILSSSSAILHRVYLHRTSIAFNRNRFCPLIQNHKAEIAQKIDIFKKLWRILIKANVRR